MRDLVAVPLVPTKTIVSAMCAVIDPRFASTESGITDEERSALVALALRLYGTMIGIGPIERDATDER